MNALSKKDVKKELDMTTRSFKIIQKILNLAKKFDLEHDGLYDARSGCVNIWCSPEDKPECWHEPTKGCLKFARDYVGGLYWDRNGEVYTFYIDVAPYALAERRKNKIGWENVSDQEWKQCIYWVEGHARSLIKLAKR